MPLHRLPGFIDAFEALLASEPDDASLRKEGSALLAGLVAHDDWLPAGHARPDPARYRQIPLHIDARKRFSVVAFVWGPGQSTPIHDHTVWGLIGMLRGAELSQPYRFVGAQRMVEAGPALRIAAGQVEAVGPEVGDIHRVRNAHDDRTSISIHVYGGDIGAIERGIYREDGRRDTFVSGYTPADLDRADAPRPFIPHVNP